MMTAEQFHKERDPFEKPEPGEWIQPQADDYLMRCCDCGLTHAMDFRIYEGRVQFRAYRVGNPPPPKCSFCGEFRGHKEDCWTVETVEKLELAEARLQEAQAREPHDIKICGYCVDCQEIYYDEKWHELKSPDELNKKLDIAEGHWEHYAREFEAAEQRLQEAQATNRELNRRNQALEKSLNAESGRKSWYGYYSAALQLFTWRANECDELRERLRQREAELEQRWIAVGERLPGLKMRNSICAAANWKGASDHVLVSSNWLGHRQLDIGYLTEWNKGPQWAESHGQFITHVTHWQPLPAPPKEAK